MTKKIFTLIMLAVTAALLTGCYKADAKLELNTDNTVSGSVIIAVDVQQFKKSLTDSSLLGPAASGVTRLPADATDEEVRALIRELLVEDRNNGSYPANTQIGPYSTRTYEGREMVLERVPFKEFEQDGSFAFSRDGKVFNVNLGSAADIEGSFFESPDAEIKIAVTFPGDVTETTGKIQSDNRTVVWELSEEGNIDLTATGAAVPEKPVSATFAVAMTLAGIALIVLALGVAYYLYGRHGTSPAAAAHETTENGSTPTVPEEQSVAESEHDNT